MLSFTKRNQSVWFFSYSDSTKNSGYIYFFALLCGIIECFSWKSIMWQNWCCNCNLLVTNIVLFLLEANLLSDTNWIFLVLIRMTIYPRAMFRGPTAMVIPFAKLIGLMQADTHVQQITKWAFQLQLTSPFRSYVSNLQLL